MQLKDAEGKTLVRVGNIETEKGILGWAMNSSNLGKIRIGSVEADVVTYDGTSNIEEALKPLLEQQSASDSTSDQPSSATTYLGQIEVIDTRFNLSSARQQPTMDTERSELSMILPRQPSNWSH